MSRRIVIDPVTRIEGHARISIALDLQGRVRDARVEVTALRGFEAICLGRPVREMPALTARICGICPVSHSVAAAKAGDLILGADPPPAARALRRLVLLGALVQSHATSFFVLSAPDLALARDARPELRSFLGVAQAAPDLARDGVVLRRFGQEVVERVAGRRVHPAYAIPGGVTRPLDGSARDHLAAEVPAALAAAERTLAWWSARRARWADDAPWGCGDRDAVRLAHVGPGGALDHAEGLLRAVSPRGEVLDDALAPADCLDRIVERPVPWSYAKLCAWRDRGGREHAYSVGPIARLEAAERCGTPRADRALQELRRAERGPHRSALAAHEARLVEILHGVERIRDLLEDGDVLSEDVLAPAGARRAEAVGACEAPRGALFHHYRVDEDGLVTGANLVIPTGQNARAMNRAVREVARRALDGDRITSALRARVQEAVRAFDPCMSCATHSADRRCVELRLLGPGGEVLDEWPPAE